MIGDKFNTGGRGTGPGDTSTQPDTLEKKPRGRRCFQRTNLESLNKVLVEKAEYIPVKIVNEAKQKCIGRLIDISEGGCQVVTPVFLKEEEMVQVSLTINKRSINARATVKRINTQGEVNLVGMQFASLANVSKEFLRAVGVVAKLDRDEIGRMRKLLLTGRQV